MRPRLSGLRDRALGAPEGASAEAGLRALRWGGPAARARALRSLDLGVEGVRGAALGALEDPAPGVRRAASWALARVSPDGGLGQALLAAAARERCDEARLAMALAAARHGVSARDAWAVVDRAARRTLWTCYGARAPGVFGGAAELRLRWLSALCPGTSRDDPEAAEVLSLQAARARAREALSREPDDPARLQDLAGLQDPQDLDLLAAALGGSGRRRSLSAVVALGVHGDPRALPLLRGVLEAVDVDPGAGFAGRARAAVALGRLGLPEASGLLVDALEHEALDQEGRPGAGLGVQLSVRVVLLGALGECGDPGAARTLCDYLANTAGSAAGGFYLPAMDALWKLGQASAARAALKGPEIAAANALGVLAALGLWAEVATHRGDPRPAVAAVARSATG